MSDKKKDDLVSVALKESAKFRISANAKLTYYFGILQSAVFILYAIFGLSVYFDMLIVLAVVYLFLVIAELRMKRKEREQANATPK